MKQHLHYFISTAVLIFALPAFSAIGEEITTPKQPAIQWEILKNELAFEGQTEKNKHIEFSLQLDGQEEGIFLARAYIDPRTYYSKGFDEKSFKLKGLAPGKLLHVKWTTLRQGNGGHFYDSDLLIAKYNSKWHLIFRDTHPGYSRGGLGDWQNYSLDFSFEASNQSLTITHTYQKYDAGYTKDGDENSKKNLYRYKAITSESISVPEEKERLGQHYYKRHYSIVSQWACVLREGILYMAEGTQKLDLLKLESNIEEIADFMKYGSRTYQYKYLETEELLEKLSSMNPHINPTKGCTGLIVLHSALPPYSQNHEHSYGGGQ